MAKVDVPCAFKKNVTYVTLTYHIILTYASHMWSLERRRPETVHLTSTRFTTIDIVDMRTLGRQYTEVSES